MRSTEIGNDDEDDWIVIEWIEKSKFNKNGKRTTLLITFILQSIILIWNQLIVVLISPLF